jgi:hypothetical protein
LSDHSINSSGNESCFKDNSKDQSTLIEPHIVFYQQQWSDKLQGESLTRVLDELNFTSEDSGSNKTLATATLIKVESDSKDETIFEKAELKDSFKSPKSKTLLGKRSRCVEDTINAYFEFEPKLETKKATITKNLSWQCLNSEIKKEASLSSVTDKVAFSFRPRRREAKIDEKIESSSFNPRMNKSDSNLNISVQIQNSSR